MVIKYQCWMADCNDNVDFLLSSTVGEASTGRLSSAHTYKGDKWAFILKTRFPAIDVLQKIGRLKQTSLPHVPLCPAFADLFGVQIQQNLKREENKRTRVKSDFIHILIMELNMGKVFDLYNRSIKKKMHLENVLWPISCQLALSKQPLCGLVDVNGIAGLFEPLLKPHNLF